MASSGGSTGVRGSSSTVPTADDKCACEFKLKLLTSWSIKNPARRFWSCGQMVNVCGYFYWFDEQMCDRSKYVILDMKSKITKLEDDLRICNAEIHRLQEDLRIERRTKPNVVEAGNQPLKLTVCVVLIVAVFVAVLFANLIVK